MGGPFPLSPSSHVLCIHRIHLQPYPSCFCLQSGVDVYVVSKSKQLIGLVHNRATRIYARSSNNPLKADVEKRTG